MDGKVITGEDMEALLEELEELHKILEEFKEDEVELEIIVEEFGLNETMTLDNYDDVKAKILKAWERSLN